MGRRVARTRNAGTMTEADFYGVIRSTLRKLNAQYPKGTRARSGWLPAKIAWERQSKKVGRKVFVQCQGCLQWFSKSTPKGQKNVIELHHVIPCGSCRQGTIESFVDNLFCENPDHYQTLCKACHHKETHS